MIEFYSGFPDNHVDQLEDLLKAYWSEADERRAYISSNINLNTYKTLEDLGFLKVIYALSDDKIIGLLASVISECSHTGEDKSVVEIIYTSPEHRGKGLASKLISKLEEDLVKDQVNINFFSLKTESPHDDLVLNNEYNHVENLYMKVLR